MKLTPRAQKHLLSYNKAVFLWEQRGLESINSVCVLMVLFAVILFICLTGIAISEI